MTFEHRFNQLSAWLSEQYGADDDLTTFIQSWEPFVKYVVDLRNCVDHPKREIGKSLVIKSFFIQRTESAAEILEPHFGRTGEPLCPLVAGMEDIVNELVALAKISSTRSSTGLGLLTL